MKIYFAEAPFVEPQQSKLMPILHEIGREHDAVIFGEGSPDIPFADVAPALAGYFDGMIANFEQPDSLLKQKVLYMHSLGKSVLVGMNIRLDPAEVLTDIAEPPFDPVEKRPKRVYYINDESGATAIKIQRNGLSKVQLQTWLKDQDYLFRRRTGLLPPTEDFRVQSFDHKWHGAESDARLDNLDAALRAHGEPGLDD